MAISLSTESVKGLTLKFFDIKIWTDEFNIRGSNSQDTKTHPFALLSRADHKVFDYHPMCLVQSVKLLISGNGRSKRAFPRLHRPSCLPNRLERIVVVALSIVMTVSVTDDKLVALVAIPM